MKVFSKAMVLIFILSFGFIFIVEGGGTTLRGNVLTYGDAGVLRQVQTLDPLNNPLFIIDSTKSTIIALFNADPLTPQAMAEGLIINGTFPNTSISFLGDVNNFDDINSFSRFSETNLNNGTNASSGFNAVNDIGLFVNFGIGSSNFEIGGENLSNQGAIASFTPKGLDFINVLNGPWRWRSSNVTNRITVAELTDSGNLDVVGNYSGERIQLEKLDNKGPCDNNTQGTLVYENGNLSGDFFICRVTGAAFSWKKL